VTAGGLYAPGSLAPLAERLRNHQGRRAIPTAYLVLLTVLGAIPLLLLSLRVLDLSGSMPNAIGSWLGENVSLLWVGREDRTAVLHVVQLPLAALMVALTRLSLGIRVLGFRAILIAIGIREVGLLPSLVLIAVIAISVVLIRPFMRRSGMPLYARVASILALVAATMVAGLLFGSAFDSAILASFAFFPVVILAMLAESIADTVARESPAVAAWRTGTTLLLALTIAAVCSWQPLREFTLACPELILTQLLLVVLVSEFLDFRLLEDYRPTAAIGDEHDAMHIAIVRNRWNNNVLRHTMLSAPQRYRLRSVQAIADSLRDAGHIVAVLEADARLFTRLRDFFPRHALGSPGRALVINCAGGVQGRGRLAQVPSLCEMIGAPCTGPDALAMAAISDRLLLRSALADHGIATPVYRPLDHRPPGREEDGPWLVAWRFQSDREPLHAANTAAIERCRERIVAAGDEPLLAAEPEGRRLRIYVLADRNDREAPRVLPALERGKGGSGLKPAALTPEERHTVVAAARSTFRALRCRDFARLDAWLDADGKVGILQLRPIEILTPRGAAAKAARAAGLDFDEFLALAYGTDTRSAHNAGKARQATPLTEPATS
jgi:D-alanine-D-alanine ligase